jgi:hypothetical protein
MTTAKQLIEFLQQLPEDTLVEVGNDPIILPEEIHTMNRGDLFAYSDNVTLVDFRFNKLVEKGNPAFGKIILELGK